MNIESKSHTLWSFWTETEPFRFCEMELPRNQLSCVATRGVPRLLRCFGDVKGDPLGDLFGEPLLRSENSCSVGGSQPASLQQRPFWQSSNFNSFRFQLHTSLATCSTGHAECSLIQGHGSGCASAGCCLTTPMDQ